MNRLILAALKGNSSKWLAAQQLTARLLTAAKFFIVARELGPNGFGQVAAALLVYGAVEALTETGLSQAIVQRGERISSGGALAILITQYGRGTLISVLLFILSTPISRFLGAPESAGYINMIAAIPIIKGCINPGYILASRDLRFGSVAGAEFIAGIADFAVTLTALACELGPVAIILGSLAAEAVKCIASWSFFRVPTQFPLGWTELFECTRYGKWIWATNIVVFSLNSADRFYMTRTLGAEILGLYQAVAKTAQLLISDVVIACTQHMFPRMASIFRGGGLQDLHGARRYANSLIFVIFGFGLAIALPAAYFASAILKVTLGKEWGGSSELFRICIIQMLIGSLLTVFQAYFRAVGRPAIVSTSVAAQAVVLLISMPLLFSLMGIYGIVLANILALSVVLALFTTLYIRGK